MMYQAFETKKKWPYKTARWPRKRNSIHMILKKNMTGQALNKGGCVIVDNLLIL
jgi:hypothetical protein